MSGPAIFARRGPIRSSWSILWSIALVALAIGATTNLFVFSDVVQPYCSTTLNDHDDLCTPCGLRWDMFATISPTQCSNSVIDDLLLLLIAIPRFLAVFAGIAWFVTGPVLLVNLKALLSRRRRGEQTIVETIQLFLLAYILLWAGAVAAFLLL